MKKLLPLALLITTLFACNNHSGEGSVSDQLTSQAFDVYLKEKDIPKSITLFKTAILKSPSAKAYFGLGSALADAGSYDEAAQALTMAGQLGYTPLSDIMFRQALICSSRPMADVELQDSLTMHYMEVAIRMGYAHAEQFLNDSAFKRLRERNDFRAAFDDAVAAGPGKYHPDRVFYESFLNHFQQLKLPATIDMAWIGSHKPGETISYDYDRFIPDMHRPGYSRDAQPAFYFSGGIVNRGADYTTVLYTARYNWSTEGFSYLPTFFTLISYDRNGKIIDKLKAAGQKDFTDTFQVLTIHPDLSFDIGKYKPVYKDDPGKVGYGNNSIIRMEPQGTASYRIGPTGKFSQPTPSGLAFQQ